MNKGEKKIYYTISEVCKLLDLKPHQLRSWEQSLPFIAPRKNKFGHRMYSIGDIQKIKLVKKLLYEEKYTLKGVFAFFEKKNFLSESIINEDKRKTINKEELMRLWKTIKEDIENIKKIIDKKN